MYDRRFHGWAKKEKRKVERKTVPTMWMRILEKKHVVPSGSIWCIWNNNIKFKSNNNNMNLLCRWCNKYRVPNSLPNIMKEVGFSRVLSDEPPKFHCYIDSLHAHGWLTNIERIFEVPHVIRKTKWFVLPICLEDLQPDWIRVPPLGWLLWGFLRIRNTLKRWC